MSLEFAILGFLSEGDRSGYDLKTRCLDREARHFWAADQAQVYRALEKLEKSSLVTSRSVHQEGKPDRRVYKLTSRGRSALTDWLAEPRGLPPKRDPFLLQLRFADSLSDEALLGMLQATREVRQARLDGLRSRLAEHARDTRKTPTRRDVFTRMTIEVAVAAARSDIDGIDDCIEYVRAEELARESGSAPQRQLFGLPSEPGGAV